MLTDPGNGAADNERLAIALRAVPGFGDVTADDLLPTDAVGLSHDHIRLARPAPDGQALLLRVPRLSQQGLPPAAALSVQAESFRRLSPSRHTPRLRAVLPVCDATPFGALLVEDLGRDPSGRDIGHLPRLPDNLAALAVCLAAIHTLPVPSPESRSPLPDHGDRGAGLLAALARQILFAEQADAGLAADSLAAIREEWAWLRTYFDRHRNAPDPCAVLTDTHAGNFFVTPDGKAWFVDLEKVAYGNPAADLAHTTLYPSAAWDPRCGKALARTEAAAFHAAYLQAVPAVMRRAIEPWLHPMRRLVWLRTTTFFVKWRVMRQRQGAWSARPLAPDVEAHIDRHIADCLSPERIAAIRAEWTTTASPGA